MQRSSETLIVTGGGRGIGAAIARLAADKGFAVAVNYNRDARAAQSVVAEIEARGGRALAVQGDVASEDDVVRLFHVAERDLGPIKALVNNAGITGPVSRFDVLPSSVIERVLAVNVVGTMLCAREAVRRMSTHNGGNGGAIVNLASRASELGGSGEWVHYAVSKGAVDTFTIGLAREVAAEGVRVNAVSPGLIETDIQTADRLARLTPHVPMRRVGQPLEVAEVVVWLLSEAASYVTGAIVPISGGR